MKVASYCCLAVLLAASAFAQLTPGVVVDHSDRWSFPKVADFNGDGLDDVFNGRTVLLNNGSSFGAPQDLGLGAYEDIQSLLDVNGDGIPDLITYNGPLDHTWRLYIADASRHYGKPVVVSTWSQPFVADVDGDGKDDLVFFLPVRSADDTHSVATDFIVHRSRADGTFDSLPPVRIPTPDVVAVSPMVGDLDGDGIRDVVLRCVADVAILHGLGGGRFADAEMRFLPGNRPVNASAKDPWGSWDDRLADIDGDGNLDLVSVGVQTIHVLFGDGHGNFLRHAWTRIAQASPMQSPREIAIGHFTRTDRMEIAADTLAGDLVIVSYEQGALVETSRTATGFPYLEVRPGNFRGAMLTDLIAFTTYDLGEQTPPPVIYHGDEKTAAAVRTEPRTIVRRRTSAPHGSSQTVLHVTTHSPCAPDMTQDFVFQRVGMFAHAESGDAFFDGNDIYFRLPLATFLAPQEGVLTRDSNGVYSGSQNVVCYPGGPLATLTYTATVN